MWLSAFLWFSRHDGKWSLKHVSHPQDTVKTFGEEALLIWKRYGLNLWIQTLSLGVCVCVLMLVTATLRSLYFSGECKLLEKRVRFFSLNSVLYVPLHTHYTHAHTHSYSNLPLHITVISPRTASVHVCPVPGWGAALWGVRVAAGEAAWRGGGAEPGRGGGRALGGEDSLLGKEECQGSHPAEKTFPGDLLGNRGKLTLFLQSSLTFFFSSKNQFWSKPLDTQ